MAMSDYWYRNAVIYGIDVGTFMDSDQDGIGDFTGLTERIEYLNRLGINCIWLLPFFPTPNRDNGYDVKDYYGVDPRNGNLGDFVIFLREARSRGIRVIIDLVVNHTSNEHPWFQAARTDPDSPYRDYYIWADEPPEEPEHEPIFPGQEASVWTFDEEAGQYYFHEFYHFQPTLNHTNPAVREEVKKIMGFWLELGVAGFRVDAASHIIESKGPVDPVRPHGILKEYRHFASMRRGDAVLMGESDVEPHALAAFFGDGDELQLLFNFLVNNYIYLALARGRAEPLIQGLRLLPPIPENGQWTNFLRNLDELDLERLTLAQREEVFKAFAPKKNMRIFGRGIRRRLAPMMDGDRKRLELVFSLLFSLPGTPMLVYGDEIGMGEDLSLEGREAVRTAMQWSDERNAGFSLAPEDELAAPVIQKGEFSYKKVNVEDQHRNSQSLLTWMERAIRTRREHPEFSWGDCEAIETGVASVFGHRSTWNGNTVIAVHNLADRAATVTLDLSEYDATHLIELLGDQSYEPVNGGEHRIKLEKYGYRWFRVGEPRKETNSGKEKR